MVKHILKLSRKIANIMESDINPSSDNFFGLLCSSLNKEDIILLEVMTDKFGPSRCELWLAAVIGTTSHWKPAGKGAVSPRNCTCDNCVPDNYTQSN